MKPRTSLRSRAVLREALDCMLDVDDPLEIAWSAPGPVAPRAKAPSTFSVGMFTFWLALEDEALFDVELLAAMAPGSAATSRTPSAMARMLRFRIMVDRAALWLASGVTLMAGPWESYQPRVASCCSSGSEALLMPRIASPSPLLTSATVLGSSQCVVASTMAFARAAGFVLLKMPEPTKT